jgi:threonine dehydratase
LNKLLTLTDEEKERGVVCSSAGNHAQAVSHHSTRLGIDGVIVMPETTPYVKVKMTQKFGGKVLLHGDSYDEAYAKALEISEKEGRTFVHAFNDVQVVAGQGTVALELLEENPFLVF